MTKRKPWQMYLASQSPRRRELLTQMGLRFKSLSVQVDEQPHATEAPEACVARLARAKATAGWLAAQRELRIPVLGADTVVTVDSAILGKPRNEADASRMLRLLSGRRHQVVTSVAVCADDDIEACTVVSDVYFRSLSEQELSAYWRTGEGADKAGSYAIQGLAGTFVARISGSYSGIVGLPLFETAQLLRKFGVDGLLQRGST